VVVAAVIAVLSWQWYSAASELERRDAAAAHQRRAEQVALDYATGAAQMSFENTQEWRGRLTANTTPELTTRLARAAASMEQLIGPMQWSSSARPIAAKVESESNGVYRVVCFVDVLTKNVQAPDGVQSTATYKLDIDSGREWAITEISGIDSALGGGAPR
jgi:Mce-associated membrane protein